MLSRDTIALSLTADISQESFNATLSDIHHPMTSSKGHIETDAFHSP